MFEVVEAAITFSFGRGVLRWKLDAGHAGRSPHDASSHGSSLCVRVGF